MVEQHQIKALAKALGLPETHPAVIAAFKAAAKEVQEHEKLAFLEDIVPGIRDRLGTGWLSIRTDGWHWKPGSPKRPGEPGESEKSSGTRGRFNQEQKSWVEQRIREGYANAAISRALKVSEGTVQGIRKRLDPPVKATKPASEDIPQELVEKFPVEE